MDTPFAIRILPAEGMALELPTQVSAFIPTTYRIPSIVIFRLRSVTGLRREELVSDWLCAVRTFGSSTDRSKRKVYPTRAPSFASFFQSTRKQDLDYTDYESVKKYYNLPD